MLALSQANSIMKKETVNFFYFFNILDRFKIGAPAFPKYSMRIRKRKRELRFILSEYIMLTITGTNMGSKDSQS